MCSCSLRYISTFKIYFILFLRMERTFFKDATSCRFGHESSESQKLEQRGNSGGRVARERAAGMRRMIADGGSCIGFEGPGAELVWTNDYN